MSWGTKTVQGVVYDLAHLDPFNMQVTMPGSGGGTYDVRVQFGCHTFTREWAEADHPSALVLDGGKGRCFCPVRHSYSLNLPAILRYAAGGKVHFSNNMPFLIINQPQGVNGPYAIYFDVLKASRTPGIDAIVDVRSAHVKPNVPLGLPKIGFATIVDLKMKGKQISAPKK